MLLSCQSDSENSASQTEKDTQDKALRDSVTSKEASEPTGKVRQNHEVSIYICPNSCPEGRLNEAGSCPACGMELVENPDYEAGMK